MVLPKRRINTDETETFKSHSFLSVSSIFDQNADHCRNRILDKRVAVIPNARPNCVFDSKSDCY